MLKPVKDVLMERDGMLEEDAEDLITEFKEALDELLESGCEGMSGVVDAETLIKDYFGLEPDYLMEFI